MRYLAAAILAVLSTSASGAPITYLFEGESIGLVRGSPISARVTFDLREVFDTDPSNTRDSFGRQSGDLDWLGSFLVEYSDDVLGNSNFAGSDAGIVLIDSETDSIRLFSSVPFVATERFTQGIELNLSGVDLFAPGTGGLSGSIFDITQFLDDLTPESLLVTPGSPQGLYRDGNGGNVTFNITRVTRVANSVPEPFTLPMLMGLLILIVVRMRRRDVLRKVFETRSEAMGSIVLVSFQDDAMFRRRITPKLSGIRT